MSKTNSTPSTHPLSPPLNDLVKTISSRGLSAHKSTVSTPKPTRVHKSALMATAPTPKTASAPSVVKPMSAFDKAMSSMKPTDPDYVLAKFAELYGSDSDASIFSSITSPSSLDTDDEQGEYLSSLCLLSKTNFYNFTSDPDGHIINFSGYHIPLPNSLVEPSRVGFQPMHLVILVGQEVGVFTSWCVGSIISKLGLLLTK